MVSATLPFESPNAGSLRRPRWFHAVILGAIGLVILAGLLVKFPWNQVAAAMASIPLWLVGGVLLLQIVTIALKVFRFSLLMGRVPGAARTYLIGQAVNQVTPTGTGEATRIYVGKVRGGIPVETTLTAVVIERVADVAFLVAVTLLATSVALFPRSSWPVLAVPATVLALAILFLGKPTLLGRLGTWVERTFHLPLERPLRDIQAAIENIRTRYTALGSVLVLTPMAWLMDSVALFVLLTAAGAPVNFFVAFLYTCVSELLGAFSFLPGGIGAREAVIVLLFPGEVGAQALAAALLFRLTAVLPLFVGGLGSLVTFRHRATARI